MDKLSTSIRINKGLRKMGIFSYLDVLKHLPRRYEIITPSKEEDFVDKARVTIVGKVISQPLLKKGFKVNSITFMVLSRELRRSFNIIAYNREYIKDSLPINELITLWGLYDYKKNEISLINYVKGELDLSSRVRPIYSLPNDIQNHEYVRLVHKALKETENKIYSIIPYYFQNKYRLVSRYQAFSYAHTPISMEQVRQSLRHLKYEEALMFSLKNKMIHEANKSLSKIKKEAIDYSLCEPFTSSLPFKLTEDQIKASEEIINDMNESTLMYRLLQGDVGTGKTVISFVALYANYLRGDQGAIMAPTDALARQHYKNALEMFKNTKIKIALLVGNTSTKDKNQIYDEIEEGSIDIIIGTHALFTKRVQYSSLGLVIIDEQHRFGVNQRQALLDKGKDADLLMMSATPIPRSLALTLYGDLDITTLNTYPSFSRSIETHIVSFEDKKIDNYIEKALNSKQKVYVVAPLIEYSDDRFSVEELYKEYEKKYPNQVVLLHGKMKAEEKENALDEFINGDKPILVSTQVIEVGIDVKSATLMIIYDASNFGLASLHQLRGRIGRDGTHSTCLLAINKNDKEAEEKLSILVTSNDGFKIAEEDMRLRGPGELTGLKQSGLPDFAYLNVINDLKIFVTARDDADYILKNRNEKGFSYIINRAEKLLDYEEINKA